MADTTRCEACGQPTFMRCYHCKRIFCAACLPMHHWSHDRLDRQARALTPSADLPACRDEDPAQPAVLAAAYPDPPEYQHPEDDNG